MKVQGKVIVVTGAGSGMGQELTVLLVKKGAKVAMADVNEKGMEETASKCGSENVIKYVLDITDRAAVEKFPELIINHFGAIDGIINNAGIIQPFVSVNELDYDHIEHVMNINFFGALNITKTFLPYLLKRPVAHIVNVSSMGGFMPFPRQTIYGASKAAIKLLTEGLYAELMDTNVHVTVIFPGAVNTHIMSNSGLASREEEEKSKNSQPNKALPANKAAEIIINGIEKDKYRIIVGKDASIMDKLYRISPSRAVRLIVKKMGKLGM